MNYLSSHNRNAAFQKAQNESFDLIIIGGGITGAGIALDAASRGLKTLLLEKNDFASGTSSRSTKLIHGGLRYLKQFEIALVREVGMERAIVHRLAPHLVVSEKMLLPLVEGGTYGRLATSFGLMIYDVLAGVESEDQRIMLNKDQTQRLEPLLDGEGLKGSGLYAEYRTDDARLTIEVIKTAAAYDAISLNYAEVTDFVYAEGKVTGVRFRDCLTGTSHTATSRYVISAAGPWVDKIRKKDGSLNGKRLHLTKGVHLVVPHEKLPVSQSIYFDVPDGRMIFAIPRGKVTYVGTTDTDYHDNLDHVITNQEDAEYLLEAVNHTFPSIELSLEDVDSSWAGLRPLIHEEGKSASELSRKDEIFLSPNGLISIAGGKLTGYRKMAEKVVDLVAKKMRKDQGRELPDCRTKGLILTGGAFKDADGVTAYKDEVFRNIQSLGLDMLDAEYLVSNYGNQANAIITAMKGMDDLNPYASMVRAEIQFCLENELVFSLLDFCSRRSGRLYFDIESLKSLQTVILSEFQQQLDWDESRLRKEREELELAVYEAQHFPPLKVMN
ncbi:MAG: glycerol-3-phosphate dehydrogenase/oxidase [Bacteroidota bacterium]